MGGGGGAFPIFLLVPIESYKSNRRSSLVYFDTCTCFKQREASVECNVGFHLTSLKFELQNYLSYRDFTFTQLEINFHTDFRFKRVLGFVIEYA